MKQIFDNLREQIEKCSVEINGTKLLGTHTARILLNRAELEWEADKCEWVHKRYHANCLCKCNDNHFFLDYDLVSSFRVCPYCRKPIKIVEVE